MSNNHADDYVSLLRECELQEVKTLYEGIAAVYVMSGYRKWHDLFPSEKEEIFKVRQDASDSFWSFLDAGIKKAKDKHGIQ